jgi:hypothetical protein
MYKVVGKVIGIFAILMSFGHVALAGGPVLYKISWSKSATSITEGVVNTLVANMVASGKVSGLMNGPCVALLKQDAEMLQRQFDELREQVTLSEDRGCGN